MRFDSSDYQNIIKKVKARERVLFDVAREATVFNRSPAPSKWTPCPLSILSNTELRFVRGCLALQTSWGALLHRVEFDVQARKGCVFYKYKNSLTVRVMILW
ncbi:hypothetical protein HMEPL2_18530 [Vreelandella aquamarina]|mgnify:CR=1 FL=1|uniref:Uncharacterized protein n=1 Tax=Vreelandella aquamarina TaxID=77097 RepID=A0A6F8XBC6_9GAMM|nr:hypothetical protein [Halomonas meridiana]BCB71502.1 hypothetical protein HMEPL2_18530 [Halomonas meridiana]